jgi:CxxC motif-containing protein (DUF1111 family)
VSASSEIAELRRAARPGTDSGKRADRKRRACGGRADRKKWARGGRAEPLAVRAGERSDSIMRPTRPIWGTILCAALWGCGGGASREDDGFKAEAEEVAASQGTKLGDPLPNLDADETTRFAGGKAEFASVEAIADGLGPVFNDTACGNCHSAGALGGASDHTVTRYGKLTDGVFDPLTNEGGTLVHARGIGPITNAAGRTCNYVGEVVPTDANVQTKRVTTPVFGLGLVDATPDETFEALAKLEARNWPSTAGRAAHVTNVTTNAIAVGKFGWKAQNPTLHQFAGDAYVNEMGITSPEFPHDTCPQGKCDLLACDPRPDDPEDADGADVTKFTDFMTFIAPPPRGYFGGTEFSGKALFDAVGCARCHTPNLRTGHSASAALDEVVYHPFSDFLLHDMGGLGDQIVQADASLTEMRTAPLWGVGARPLLLHDGRATTIDDAIRAHAGQGAAAAAAFADLCDADRAALVAFVRSL